VVATTKKADKLVPVEASQVELIDLGKIDPRKVYRAVLQLGARKTWRKFGKGQWKLVASDPGTDEQQYKHVPAIHETGPISGATLRGLASGHNSWVEANRDNDRLKGDVSKQLLVLSFEETDEAAEDVKASVGSPEYLNQVVAAAVKQTTEAVTAAFTAMIPQLVKAIHEEGKSGK
jgi:hypothetical protein